MGGWSDIYTDADIDSKKGKSADIDTKLAGNRQTTKSHKTKKVQCNVHTVYEIKREMKVVIRPILSPCR